MNVSAIIVTRGDVALDQIVKSLPAEWEKIIWDNSRQPQPPQWWKDMDDAPHLTFCGAGDLAVYGRYAALGYASHDLIYVQDDDVIVSDPQAIVDMWDEMHALAKIEQTPDPEAFVVANMPQEFRHDFYDDHCLVGFGAVFHRDLPHKAFGRFALGLPDETVVDSAFYRRTCDVVFTALTPRVLVDVPYENLPWADGPDRMYRQPEHVAERTRMLELVRKVRDA